VRGAWPICAATPDRLSRFRDDRHKSAIRVTLTS
jgi:hypothetical protein